MRHRNTRIIRLPSCRCALLLLLLLLLCVYSSGVSSALAQDAVARAAREQARNFSQPFGPLAKVNANGVALPQEATEAELQTDADLGEQWILKNSTQPKRYSIFADVSGFHTSNVALAHGREVGDSFLVATIGGGYVQPLGGPWTLGLNLAQTVFRYERFGEFNFDSLSAGAGLSFQAPGNSVFTLQYTFSRLSQESSFNNLFSGHSLAAIGTKTIQLSTADAVSFGMLGAFNLADPSTLQRGDAGIFANYNLSISRTLSLSVAYRATVFVYPKTDRVDLNQALSAGLRFQINRWFSLGATASGVLNDSNRTSFDYHVWNVGGGLTGTIQF